LGAYGHQDVPFEKLVEVLQPERDVSRSPLFQVKIEFGNNLIDELQLSGLILSSSESRAEVIRYDLHLFLIDTGPTVIGNLVYDKDLFDATTILKITGQLEAVLQATVTQPESRLNALVAVQAEFDREHQNKRETEVKEARLLKYKHVKRKLVDESELRDAGNL
jgi:non-ribosomal peptide synthetase component F